MGLAGFWSVRLLVYGRRRTRSTATLVVASKEVRLEVNAEEMTEVQFDV